MMVQDRKTGQWYDTEKAIADMFQNPEYIAMVQRMKNENGIGWPTKKD